MSVQSIHDVVNLKDVVITPSVNVYKIIIYHQIDIDTLGVYLMMLMSGRITKHTPVMQTGRSASMTELSDPEILCINCGTIPRGEGNFCKDNTFTASEQAIQTTGLKSIDSLKNLVKYISTDEDQTIEESQPTESSDLYLKPLISKMVKDVEKNEQMEEGSNILSNIVENNIDPFKPLPSEFKTLYESQTAVEFKLGWKGSVTNLKDVTGSMVVIKNRMTKQEFCTTSASVTFNFTKLSEIKGEK